ncbi:MAG: hypothetical protein ACOX8M_09230 [Marvinbryantia sp.]|jgi:hypothetical protein
MRKGQKALTCLLILLCLAGVVFAAWFLRQEQKLASERQQEISQVAAELEPINQERRQWEQKDKEWQKTLADKQKGRTCVLLSFDNMTRELYDTIFSQMDQYGFRGTFLMRNGQMPSWEAEKNDELSSGEMMQELLDAGWDYAVSVGEISDDTEEQTEYQRDFSDEFGEELLMSESESESGTGTEGIETQTEMPQTEEVGFAAGLDAALAALNERGFAQPQTVFCTQEQYSGMTEQAFVDRGFAMVSVIHMEDFPTINAEQQEGLRIIDTGVYTQRDENLEKQLDAIVSKQQSVAISINEVVKISKNIDYDLNLTTFTSLLNYLKELENDRKINVLTYSEYQQYEQLRQESYEAARKEYAVFREEMQAAIEKLDQQEAAIAQKLKETEYENTVY